MKRRPKTLQRPNLIFESFSIHTRKQEKKPTLCMLSITDLNHKLTPHQSVRFHKNNVEDYPL